MQHHIETSPSLQAIERLRSQEITRVLEIGPSHCPSIAEDGASFYDNNNVEYYSLELPKNIWDYRVDADTTVGGNMNALPFRDECIDVILMKSIFGQFTGIGESDIDDIRTWGLLEASRVLTPGGLLVVFEENTPWYADYIEGYIEARGMDVVDTVYKTDSWEQRVAFPEWSALRGLFYAADNDRYSGRGWGDKDFVKCIVGQKPKDAVLEEFHKEICVNGAELAERRWNKRYGKEVELVDPVYKPLLFKRIV